MAYTLENLAADCNRALKDDAGSAGRAQMAKHLESALADKEFVASQFPAENEVPRQVIYEDPDFGFCILRTVFGWGDVVVGGRGHYIRRRRRVGNLAANVRTQRRRYPE